MHAGHVAAIVVYSRAGKLHVHACMDMLLLLLFIVRLGNHMCMHACMDMLLLLLFIVGLGNEANGRWPDVLCGPQ